MSKSIQNHFQTALNVSFLVCLAIVGMRLRRIEQQDHRRRKFNAMNREAQDNAR